MFKIWTYEENIWMNSSDQRDAKKKFIHNILKLKQKCLNGFLAAQPLKAISPWYWAEVYSQRAERGRKREDTVYLFSEWRVLDVRTGFHTETMARVHPAAFSLLLSLPILRLSICLWAETHGTSCSTQHTSQKFTSCSSALLLHTSPIPRTCINSPSCTQIA